MKSLIQSIEDVRLSKTNVSEAVKTIIAEAEAGFEDPIKLLTKVAFLEKIVTEAKKELIQLSLEEMAEEKRTIAGVSLSKKEAGARYDYSDSPNWIKQNEVKKAEEQKLKDIEARLKTVKGSETIVDEESGEIFQVFQPSKKSTTTIEITFPKD